MLDKIVVIVRRYDEIQNQMSDPFVIGDHVQLTTLAQERSEIEELVIAYRRYMQLQDEREEAVELVEMEDDADVQQMAKDEIGVLDNELEALTQTMRKQLIPVDKNDKKNVFVEVRAGTGGDEAGIFAADLLRMYARYAEKLNWKPVIVEENRTGVGGYKQVIMAIKGAGAYSRFKFESGVHRVQRVPQTESQGRVHTSAATVAVMPEIDPVEITLDMNDLIITAEFAGGPGGQHMQKNATAARVVHKPSGLMTKIQSERSLSQNKELAIAIIQARLQEQEEAKQDASESAKRKAQVGSGDRSEKIRTYNYPQSRVTDHRIGLSSYNLTAVMDGDLDAFIDALTIADQAEKLAALAE